MSTPRRPARSVRPSSVFAPSEPLRYSERMPKKHIVVVGGGAAGFFGAIKAAEDAPGAKVLLLEKSPELLAKVTLSGGGRCNVTHHCFDVDRLVRNYPRGSRELLGPFHRFQPRDTVQWFESRGVKLKVEADGRMFPVTDRSSSIVDALQRAVRQAGVVIRTSCGLRELTKHPEGGFRLRLTDGSELNCDRLLLATGGNKNTAGYGLAASVGHTIEPPVPSLFTFHINDPSLHALAGIAVPEAQVTAPDLRLVQNGPLLITHWGLSGPAVLKLSAWGARAMAECDYAFALQVMWQRGPRDAMAQTLSAWRTRQAARTVVSGGPLEVPVRLWAWLSQRAGVEADRVWSRLTKEQERRLVEEITACRLEVTGKSTFKEEFVTCGGVRLNEVDFKTMESRVCPGLHLAGEVLNIDAVTGGFNFQAAWTTGWLAGQAMAGA
jgi:predicted Rossmann fold flavoprotein